MGILKGKESLPNRMLDPALVDLAEGIATRCSANQNKKAVIRATKPTSRSFTSMKITWRKTPAETGEQLNNYTAVTSSGIDVGRIHKIFDLSQAGMWHWAFLLGQAQFRLTGVSGETVSLHKAKTEVEKAFERYLDTPGSDGGGRSRIPVKGQNQGS